MAAAQPQHHRQRGPAPDRRPWKLDKDPWGLKADLRRLGISQPQIAARAGVSTAGYVSTVLAGRSQSSYVVRAARALIREAEAQAAVAATRENGGAERS